MDANGWKLPAGLSIVYPLEVGQAPEEALVPWFWKPFWSLPVTLFLGMLIPGLVAAVIGFFVFRSRVRGVFFAILTQAVTLAALLVLGLALLCFGSVLASKPSGRVWIEIDGDQILLRAAPQRAENVAFAARFKGIAVLSERALRV